MTITFVGDICLDSIKADNFKLEDKIESILLSSNIVIGNLESPVTASKNKKDLLPIHLKTDVKAIKVLKYFSALSLANNHIFDYGMEGFNDTTDFLSQNNIHFFGAGKNAIDANSPLLFEKDIPPKVAVISGTRWTNASSNEFGTARFKGHDKSIRDLKLRGYFVIYYPHWGYEYILTPPPDVRTHAKKMIELGVDLVVGTHPHILQGFEEYKGKYIFYSLGNFIFHDKYIESLAPINCHNRVKTSAVLKFHLKNSEVERFEVYPVEYSNEMIRLVEGEKKEEILADMNEHSKNIKNSKIAYLIKYYSQAADIVKQNRKIRRDFQKIKKQNILKKILLFKGVTRQDLLNRLASLLFY